MSTPAQIAANTLNAQSSPGPRTEAGMAASSKNATKHGLFTTQDFIRPDEQPTYDELDANLRGELSPVGTLEQNLVNEIRRAMWRLRRCGQIEESLRETPGFKANQAEAGVETTTLDPMQIESTAKLQTAVDRARTQALRIYHKCVAELRTLQTERIYRGEVFKPGVDLTVYGLADWRAIQKSLNHEILGTIRIAAEKGKAELAAVRTNPQPQAFTAQPQAPATPAKSGSFCKTPRNAQCPCGSGQKHKRCCGKDAPPMLHAA
jgi:hypothetical protein